LVYLYSTIYIFISVLRLCTKPVKVPFGPEHVDHW
jgi:hypothetical protein